MTGTWHNGFTVIDRNLPPDRGNTMKKHYMLVAVLVSLMLAGCGKSEEEKRRDAIAAMMEKAEAARAESLKETAKRGRTVETLKPLVWDAKKGALVEQKPETR
jgi:hypothetical protein